MDLLEDGFDADFCIDNEDGVHFGDVFYLCYYGINVFFYVCGLDRHRVRIYELAKKRGKLNGETIEYLTPTLRATTSPKIVLEHNTWTKSEFWVNTSSDGKLIIPVWDGPLVYGAIKLGHDTPIIGDMYAIPLKKEKKEGITTFYWLVPKPKKEQKRNFLKISA